MSASILNLGSHIVNPEPSTSTPLYLDWTQRTLNIHEKIEQVFSFLSTRTRSYWTMYNECDTYGICSIDDYSLMKKVIQQAPTTQKAFYVLDIGAGEFQ